jgi:hypothetical protein
LFNCAKQVNVLGTDYNIIITNEEKLPRLNDETAGLCYVNTKQIAINNYENDAIDKSEEKDICIQKQKVLRHEIVHAYSEESGISNFNEIDNDFIVDWIAKQAPKMLISFLECGALSEDVIGKITKIINHQYDDNFTFIENN